MVTANEQSFTQEVSPVHAKKVYLGKLTSRCLNPTELAQIRAKRASRPEPLKSQDRLVAAIQTSVRACARRAAGVEAADFGRSVPRQPARHHGVRRLRRDRAALLPAS